MLPRYASNTLAQVTKKLGKCPRSKVLFQMPSAFLARKFKHGFGYAWTVISPPLTPDPALEPDPVLNPDVALDPEDAVLDP
jgi:hypothetical protein